MTFEDNKNICVFCGAQNNVPQSHLDIGRELGEWMGENDMQLVYGGGDCGIMGAVANGVLTKEGRVTGVFPESLKEIEKEHQSLTEIVIVDSMHTRKELMYKRSDAFVILPGGFGTMDEMFEIMTWKQLRLHSDPIFVFNHEGYWDHLVALMENIINTGFAKPETRELYKVVNDFDTLKQELLAF